ncbi:MAG: glycosyltransferase, partial [Microlunatus sp.]|nr:glycosyltransferase [Microlunatus sp.]
MSRAEARRTLGIADPAEDRASSLAMATRLVPYKGIDDAMRALADHRAQSWTLHVYGIRDAAHPAEADALRRLAADAGVAERVRLHPARDDIGSLFAAFDAVAVLTKAVPGSAITTESFSMVALEAQQAGTPVISVAPVCERVGDGGIGVRPGCPSDVARALQQIADGQFPARLHPEGRAPPRRAPPPPAKTGPCVGLMWGKCYWARRTPHNTMG